jgi:hypothetical protein
LPSDSAACRKSGGATALFVVLPRKTIPCDLYGTTVIAKPLRDGFTSFFELPYHFHLPRVCSFLNTQLNYDIEKGP